MSNTLVFPVLAVDVPYKNASQPKPASSDMSLLIVMLTTVQEVTYGRKGVIEMVTTAHG
jgi:hypothetical protein